MPSTDPDDGAGSGPGVVEVRPTRTYHSPARERRAAETRVRVVEAAADLFVELGWSGATMRKIAARAGVSAETVHSVGSKAFLLVEAHRTRYTGRGGWQAITEDPVWEEITGTEDPVIGLGNVVEFLVRAHRASADLWVIMRATALTEPVVRDAAEELHALKRHTFRLTVEWLLRIGIIESPTGQVDLPGLTAQTNLVMSAETYVQLTRDYGHTEDDYRAWLRATIPRIRAA